MKPNVFMLIDATIVNGPAKGLFQLLKHAPTTAFDYVLCNFSYSNSEKNDFYKTAEEKGLKIRSISQKNRFDPSPIWQAVNIIRQEKCNIIQTHSYKCHLIGFLISRITGIPWLAFSHGWTSEDWKVKAYHKLDLWLLRYSSSTIAVSPLLKKTLDRYRGKRRETELVLNAVEQDDLPDAETSQNIRNLCGASESDFLVGCFGRLSKEKGQEFLLRAFNNLHLKLPELHLVFLGEGPERRFLESLTHKLGLSKKVFFLGHQKNMRDYYKAIDILALPSLSEGLPNVVLEAMSFCTPIVASRVGAVPDILEDGKTAWLVAPGDEAGLTSRLDEIVGAKDELPLIAAAARDSLYPQFCPKKRSLHISTLYYTLLENRKQNIYAGVNDAAR